MAGVVTSPSPAVLLLITFTPTEVLLSRQRARICHQSTECADVTVKTAHLKEVDVETQKTMSDIKMQKTTMGTCSYPGCDWAGQYANHKKHAYGAGLGDKRRCGMHEGCDCKFVPDAKRVALDEHSSVLQSTMAHLPHNAQSLHAHLQGEYYRRTQMQFRIEHLKTQSFGVFPC